VVYSAEELTGKPLLSSFTRTTGTWLSIGNVRRMKGEELPHIYHFRIIHRDGNVRWVELNAVLDKLERESRYSEFPK